MKPIYINQNDSNEKFLYLQLYDIIKQRILTGEMKSGEKLPSLRTLSKDLGISITTAELAYNQLLVEGYISSRPNPAIILRKFLPLRHTRKSPHRFRKSAVFLSSHPPI